MFPCCRTGGSFAGGFGSGFLAVKSAQCIPQHLGSVAIPSAFDSVRDGVFPRFANGVVGHKSINFDDLALRASDDEQVVNGLASAVLVAVLVVGLNSVIPIRRG